MFNPISAKDRINYGEVLLPPAGFHLEKAIGTTYSLDLETLTAVSISLGLIEDTDSELISNPICMLNALQKISDKIIVFCEAGQIKNLSKASPLCLVLEKIIVPVKLPFDKKINRFPAFHPKMWLLEYAKQNKEKKYRFVVLSRNLTFDHSWDVACAMDGAVTLEQSNQSSPIIDFLEFLNKQLDNHYLNFCKQKEILSQFKKILKKVEFTIDNRFVNFEICPLGIGTKSYDMPSDELFKENFNELVVMSPFLTGSVIQGLNEGGKKLTGPRNVLITRRTELSKISKAQASNFDVYVMKDEIIDGEDAISEEKNNLNVESNKQDIHAKIFIRKKGGAVSLYLGSMNASYAAINSNVELVLKLQPKNKDLNGCLFLDDVMGKDREGKKNPFELVSLDNNIAASMETSQDKAEKIVKNICRLEMNANVESFGEKYNVKVNIKMYENFDGVKLHPLLNSKDSELLPEIKFESLSMLELSEFYVLTVSVEDCTLERVIMIPTTGMPEGRESEIVKSVIKDRKSFIEYVSFVLGEDYVWSFLENNVLSGMSGEWEAKNVMSAVYEKMLKASLHNPEKLNEIQYITRFVEEENIIPEDFRKMYKVFCDALKIKQV